MHAMRATEKMRISAAVFLYSLACTAVLGEECLETVPFERPANQPTDWLESGIQALVPQYVFQCFGRVTEWQAYVATQGRYWIDFQVWRADPEAENTYNQVDSNYFPGVANASRILILPVLEQQMIDVEPGDVIGFFVRSNRETSVELNIGEDVNVYVIYAENVDSGRESISYYDYYYYSEADEVLIEMHGAPLIKAVVESGSPMYTPIPQSSNPEILVTHQASISATLTPSPSPSPGNTETIPVKTIIPAVIVTFIVSLFIFVSAGLLFPHVWKRLQSKRHGESEELWLHMQSAESRSDVTNSNDHIYAEPSTLTKKSATVNNPVYNGVIDNAAYLEQSLSDNIKINPAYRPTGNSYYNVEPTGNIPAQMGMDYSNLPGSIDVDYEPVSPVMPEAEVNSAEEMALKLAKQHYETESTNGNEYEDIPL